VSNTAKTFRSVLGGGEAEAGTGGNIKFIRPKELAAGGVTGVVAEGIYEGTIPNNFDNTREDYKVRQNDGTLIILNSTGSLRNQLSQVAAGSYVRVNYKGMEKMKSGRMAGKEAHSFEVLVAD
jgi:hypothetical protein